jgi:hypothetical protein
MGGRVAVAASMLPCCGSPVLCIRECPLGYNTEVVDVEVPQPSRGLGHVDVVPHTHGGVRPDSSILPDSAFYIPMPEGAATTPQLDDKIEQIDHPIHYGGKSNLYEAIKVIEAWGLGFCLGNCVKYIARAGKKGDAIEDLEKARWYLDREINKLLASDPESMSSKGDTK